jgi:predicted Holliday junction resolvase-like endonuclease
MHSPYIIAILVLTIYFLRNAHLNTIKTIKLKKEIDSLLSSKTDLLLNLESLQFNDTEYKKQIASLNDNVNQQSQEVANLKLTTSDLQSALKRNTLKHEIDLEKAVQAARKDSLKRSRSVLRGQATEHLAPYILKGTNPKDYRFLGNPIDYICFEGLSDLLDGQANAITSVHFIDIKTGKASLNKSQRRIRDAIKNSQVEFSTINLDTEIEKQNDKIKQEFEVKSSAKSQN